MADQTAEALAAHPRWEWRATMCVSWRGRRYTVLSVTAGGRCVHLVETDNGVVRVSPYRDGDSDDPAVYRDCGGWNGTSRMLPDLSADATAGILLGMVREWGDERGFALDVLFGTQYSSVHVGPAGGYGPTLGEAAGGCLLSCWEYDAADGGAR